MRSREIRWLLAKEWRDLLASRAWWLLLLASGLLVGHAFLTAVDTYAEMSGEHGGPAALAQGLSPLDGIVVPVFGALSLVATLLLPFLVIRVIAHEKANGAWKLLVQGPVRISTQLLVKVCVILAGWLCCWLPALLALALWAGGHDHLGTRETLTVLLGHALFAWLTIGVAAAAAAIANGEATAAIVTLSFTIGTWALDFIGAARGGLASELAAYTPTAVLRSFEEGLLRVDAALVMFVVGAAAMMLAATWLYIGARRSHRWSRSGLILAAAVIAVAGASRIGATRDLSENRRNSFPAEDEAALRQIREPVKIEIHLAPEDPRLTDLRSGIIEKLERVIPGVEVTQISQSQTGLFEQPGDHYGEVWYHVGPRSAMSRSSIPAIVLPVLYELAGLSRRTVGESDYPGYPLVRRPRGLGWIYFVAWPLVVISGATLSRRRG